MKEDRVRAERRNVGNWRSVWEGAGRRLREGCGKGRKKRQCEAVCLPQPTFRAVNSVRNCWNREDPPTNPRHFFAETSTFICIRKSPKRPRLGRIVEPKGPNVLEAEMGNQTSRVRKRSLSMHCADFAFSTSLLSVSVSQTKLVVLLGKSAVSAALL